MDTNEIKIGLRINSNNVVEAVDFISPETIDECCDSACEPEEQIHTSDCPCCESGESSMLSWAKKEIELACENERKNSEGEPDWQYGVACYESAIRAFESLTKDGHSGMSIGFTKNILMRLIDGKPLVPIEDIPENWTDISSESCLKDGSRKYQSNRISSLFKNVSAGGLISYSDVDLCYAVYVNNPDVSWSSGVVSDIIHEMFPITMPYYPASKRIKVVCEDFLTDPKNGDYDTVGILYCIKGDERVVINRYFKEAEKGFDEISYEEYEDRRIMSLKKEEDK